jgi:inner membrane protein involved in colicin E2 resistance
MRLALSLAIMLSWPLLGIVMTARWFDSWSEALLFFVGLSLIPGLVLAVLGVPDAVLFTGLTLIWVFVWIAPAAAPRRFD